MSDETRLSEELSRRAHDVHGSMLSFDDVRGRARSIRRRRNATVAGAVAAAVALVVLVPTVLSGGSGPKSDGVDPAPPTPGHTAVLHDGTLTLPDGRTVDLGVDNEDVTQLGVLTDGRAVLAMQRPQGVRVYAADGSDHVDYPAAYNVITMSARDDVVAWVAKDLTVSILASNAPEPTTLPGEVNGSIDAVLAADHLLVGDSPTTWGEQTPDGITDLDTSEPLRVVDVNADGSLWAVQYDDDADPQYGCSGLYDPEAREMVARNCDTSGLSFSPDGQHLLGLRGDNNMFGTADVFDLDLQQVGSFAPDPTVVSRAAWADLDHLLVTTANWHDNQWSLTRVDLDGSNPTVIDGPAAGGNPEIVVEYLLSE